MVNNTNRQQPRLKEIKASAVINVISGMEERGNPFTDILYANKKCRLTSLLRATGKRYFIKPSKLDGKKYSKKTTELFVSELWGDLRFECDIGGELSIRSSIKF